MTKDVKGTKEPKDVYHFSAVDSIERLPLSEQVYVTLKQAILTGELLPQEKLNEVKIAEQLKVSATPVREAFRKLAKDNLVVIVPLRRIHQKKSWRYINVAKLWKVWGRVCVLVTLRQNKWKSLRNYARKCMPLRMLRHA